MFDVCDRETLLDAIKHPNGFRIAGGVVARKLLLEHINYIPKIFFILTMVVTTLETERLRKSEFYKERISTFQYLN